MPDFNAHVVFSESLIPVGQLRFTQAEPRQFWTFA
jgi:serine/threonine-protein kinase HipA